MDLLFKLQFAFLGILQVNSERWYSASVVETKESSKDKEFTKYNQKEGNFLPLNIRETDDVYFNNYNPWHFSKKKSNKAEELTFRFPAEDTKVVETNIKKIRKKCSKVPRKHVKANKTRTRFLEVFEVVEFDHVSCVSTSGLEGSCLHEVECQSSEGTPMGSCADGYGSCCVNVLACDSQSSAAMGWFINPSFPQPSTERLSCAVTLRKNSEDVTQMRLDFASFELLPPTEGVCQLDQFVISGQNINNVVPILCGINTGHHVYIEVSDVEGPIYLTMQTETAEKRLFSIKVTQLTASDELASPPGCLQYFTDPTGHIESYNYRDQSEIAITRTPSYLNNLNYAICIERLPATCSVTYTAGYIQIINYDIDGLPVIPPGQAGVEIFNCPSDWLLISATRLCGERLNDGSVIQDFSLNAPVTDSSAGPIVVWFRSDEGYVGRGFRLEYQQNPCRSSPH